MSQTIKINLRTEHVREIELIAKGLHTTADSLIFFWLLQNIRDHKAILNRMKRELEKKDDD